MSAEEREKFLAWLRQQHSSGEPIPRDFSWRVLQLLIAFDQRLTALEARGRR